MHRRNLDTVVATWHRISKRCRAITSKIVFAWQTSVWFPSDRLFFFPLPFSDLNCLFACIVFICYLFIDKEQHSRWSRKENVCSPFRTRDDFSDEGVIHGFDQPHVVSNKCAIADVDSWSLVEEKERPTSEREKVKGKFWTASRLFYLSILLVVKKKNDNMPL